MLVPLVRLAALAAWTGFVLAITILLHRVMPASARVTGKLNLGIGTIDVDALGTIGVFILLVLIGVAIVF